MRHILSILLLVLFLPVMSGAAQITLHETADETLGGFFGDDFKLTAYQNWIDQNLMFADLYTNKQDASAILGEIDSGTYPNLFNDSGSSTSTAWSASKIISYVAANGGAGVTVVDTLPDPLVEGVRYFAKDTKVETYKDSLGTYTSPTAWTYVVDPISDPSLLWHWDASGIGANTIIVEQETTTMAEVGTVTYVTGVEDNGASFAETTSTVSATGGANFPSAIGRVEFWFKDTTGTDVAYSTMLASATTADFIIQRRGAYPTTLRIRLGGAQWDVDVSENLWDGTGRYIKVSWDDANDLAKVQIDNGTTIESSGLTIAMNAVPVVYIGGESDGNPSAGGTIDEVKFYSNTL